MTTSRSRVCNEAVDAGLLDLDGEALRLGHPLVGAAAVGRATPERRRATHARLAVASADPERRARHLALAAPGPDRDAATACDAAADDAERRGAPAAAADLAELAVGLTDTADVARVAARRCRAAALRVAVGDPARAREHIDAGLAAAVTPAQRAPLLLVGVELAHLVGLRPAARRAAEAALAEAGDDPILRARAHAAMLAWGAEDTRDERRHAAAVLELLAGREREAPEAAADALAILADARLAAGEGLAFDLLERALELDRSRPDFVVGSLEVLGGDLRTADRIDDARDRWAEALARLERAGYESRRVSTLTQMAWTEVLAGDHPAARVLLDTAGHLAADLGADATGPRLYAAHLDALLGDREAVRTAAASGLAEAEAAGNRWVAALWHRALGIDALAAGEPGSAADHLNRTLDAAVGLGILEPNWARVDADLVEALTGAGRLEEAETALAAFGARTATARSAVVGHGARAGGGRAARRARRPRRSARGPRRRRGDRRDAAARDGTRPVRPRARHRPSPPPPRPRGTRGAGRSPSRRSPPVRRPRGKAGRSPSSPASADVPRRAGRSRRRSGRLPSWRPSGDRTARSPTSSW